MKHFKKFIAIICLSAMMVCCFSYSASALVLMDGYFGYELNTYTREATLAEYDGSETIVTIPGSYTTYPVTRLGSNALSGNSTMQTLNIPTSMNKIDNRALSKCTSLSSVRFPANITSLGERVCLNCTSLQTAYVYAAINTLPAYSFAGCSSLTTVDLNQSITGIGNYAFLDCDSLSNVGFLSQISTIGKSAFDGTGITQLTIPESITSIPDYAFANCSALVYAEIPASVSNISSCAFYNDPNLTLGVWYDSYAHSYAESNNIPYVLLDQVKLGDTDSDGNVTINDVTTIQRHIARLTTLEGIYLDAADINRNGVVDISDATEIQRFLADFPVIDPIGEAISH